MAGFSVVMLWLVMLVLFGIPLLCLIGFTVFLILFLCSPKTAGRRRVFRVLMICFGATGAALIAALAFLLWFMNGTVSAM